MAPGMRLASIPFSYEPPENMSRLRRFYDQLNEEDCLHSLRADLSSAIDGETNIRVDVREPAARAPAVALMNPVQAEEIQSAPGAAYVCSDAGLDRTVRVISNAANPAVTERYRSLRTRLLQERELNPFRTLMIASPNPNEGKSITTLNLALSFAMFPSSKILVVDADLRKGSLGKWLGVRPPQPGLSDLIEGTAELNQVIVKSDKLPVYFMLRGESKIAPAELLNGPGVKKCFDQMARNFDLVLVDSPPVNIITDGQLIARSCDAVLLVARAFSTTQKSIEQAARDLQRCRVLGVVLNGGGPLKRDRKYSYYY
jgi:protein-tyrosine kinase